MERSHNLCEKYSDFIDLSSLAYQASVKNPSLHCLHCGDASGYWTGRGGGWAESAVVLDNSVKRCIGLLHL